MRNSISINELNSSEDGKLLNPSDITRIYFYIVRNANGICVAYGSGICYPETTLSLE